MMKFLVFLWIKIKKFIDYKKLNLSKIEIIGFFDLNENNIPIKEKVKVLSKREITKTEIAPQPKVEVKVLFSEVVPNNKIHLKEKVEFLDEKNIK